MNMRMFLNNRRKLLIVGRPTGQISNVNPTRISEDEDYPAQPLMTSGVVGRIVQTHWLDHDETKTLLLA